MAHVAQWKHGEVAEITSLLTHHKIIGIIDIGGIPAPQLQQMRGGIRAKAQIRCCEKHVDFKSIRRS